MNTSNTSRLIASIISVGVTAALFSAVIAPAMQYQADGRIRLAHSAVSAPAATQMLVAHASAN